MVSYKAGIEFGAVCFLAPESFARIHVVASIVHLVCLLTLIGNVQNPCRLRIEVECSPFQLKQEVNLS